MMDEFCDMCDASLTGAEMDENPRWGQHLRDQCDQEMTDANPATDDERSNGPHSRMGD